MPLLEKGRRGRAVVEAFPAGQIQVVVIWDRVVEAFEAVLETQVAPGIRAFAAGQIQAVAIWDRVVAACLIQGDI